MSDEEQMEEVREEVSRKRNREGKKGEDERWLLKEGVPTLFPLRLLIFSFREKIRRVVGNLGGLTGVLVSTSSSVVVMSEAFVSDSDFPIVEPQSCSLSRSVEPFV